MKAKMRWLFIIVMIVIVSILFFVFISTGGHSASNAELESAGLDYIKWGDVRRAEKLFFELYTRDSNNFTASYYLGKMYLDYPEKLDAKGVAFKHFMGKLNLSNGRIPIHDQDRNLIGFLQRNYSLAAMFLENAIRISNNNISAMYNLAIAYQRQRKYYKALALLDNILQITNNYYPAYYTKGFIYMKLGKRDMAKRYYDKCLKINPNYNPAYVNLAMIYAAMGDKKGKAMLDKIIRNEGVDRSIRKTAMKYLFDYYYDKGFYDKAIAMGRDYLKYFPQDGNMYIDIGTIYYITKKTKLARQYLEKGLEINPSDHYALNTLGKLLYDNRKFKEAILVYRKSLKRFENPATYTMLGRVYADMGDYDNAIKNLKRAIAMADNYFLAHFYLAMIMERAGYPKDKVLFEWNKYINYVKNDPSEAERLRFAKSRIKLLQGR